MIVDYNFNTISSRLNLEPGDIIARQKTNKKIIVGQKVLQGASKFFTSTHVSIVVSIDESKITLLESVHRPTHNGVSVIEYKLKEFEQYVGKGIHILKNSVLNKNLIKYISIFVENYKNGKAKTTYSFKHLLTVGKTATDTNSGRMRTVNSYKSGQLMTSKNKPRKKSICSEFIAELVKLAQIDSAGSSRITARKLMKLQKENRVMNISSEHVTAGKLENELVTKHGFNLVVVTPQDFEQAKQ